MKIAVTTREGSKVDEHFGHCEVFTIFECDNANKIVSVETLHAPAGCGCKSNIIPVLKEKGVCVVLTGNMGQGAINLLSANGIEVCRGCQGDIREVTEGFLNGYIIDSQGVCAKHAHGHSCGNH